MLKHLSDEELQLYVVSEENCDAGIIRHIHSCSECKTKVELYQLLISGIKEQSAPAFDFNLSELVLQKLPAPSKKTTDDKMVNWIFIIITAITVAAGSIYFRNYLSALFKGFGNTLLVFIGVVSSILILAGLIWDMYKKYNKEIKLLDAY